MRGREDGSVPGWSMTWFLELEGSGGFVLMAAMVAALAIVNSPWGGGFESLLHVPVLGLSVLHWINDGLMAVFFLLVALEIKREFLEGELSSPGQVVLPVVAAVGGMAAPAAVYLAMTGGDAAAARGWAIPSATDIAFSLGVLSLLGKRVPIGLKVFLATLAIVDDLGAILIIALFYSASPDWLALGGAGLVLAALLTLGRLGVTRLLPYLAGGVLLWVLMLSSGLHATIAGVALGLAIPRRGAGAPAGPLEETLHPWVAFAIMPVFALANSGVAIDWGGPLLSDPVTLGSALGLFVGKQAGVFLAGWAAVRLGVARLPEGTSWLALWGVAALTGIGFTMSLFIGGLAFPDGQAMAGVKTGVLAGSLASAVCGFGLLRLWLAGKVAAA